MHEYKCMATEYDGWDWRNKNKTSWARACFGTLKKINERNFFVLAGAQTALCEAGNLNGKRESVNVTHITSTLNSSVVVFKNSCSKCWGHGWKVDK